MKKILTIIAFVAISTSILAQKTTKAEILFFKADLSCCMKKACDQIYSDIEKVIKETYTKGNVVLKEVKLSDTQNKNLVEKYKAANETVIMVVIKKKKTKEVDLTQLVANYKKTKDLETFKKEFCNTINQNL